MHELPQRDRGRRGLHAVGRLQALPAARHHGGGGRGGRLLLEPDRRHRAGGPLQLQLVLPRQRLPAQLARGQRRRGRHLHLRPVDHHALRPVQQGGELHAGRPHRAGAHGHQGRHHAVYAQPHGRPLHRQLRGHGHRPQLAHRAGGRLCRRRLRPVLLLGRRQRQLHARGEPRGQGRPARVRDKRRAARVGPGLPLHAVGWRHGRSLPVQGVQRPHRCGRERRGRLRVRRLGHRGRHGVLQQA